ncbi:MAG: BCCT family transporter [Enterocloster sp.]
MGELMDSFSYAQPVSFDPITETALIVSYGSDTGQLSGLGLVTALFLGKLARGYKIRDRIIINLFVPTVFSMIWVSIFGGTAIHMHMQESLIPLLETSGSESIVYKLFEVLPLRQLWPIFKAGDLHMSFVTLRISTTIALKISSE